MNILFIDTETTGTDPSKHTIIEIALRFDVDGVTVDTFYEKLFNPQCDIDLGALKVNKRSMESILGSTQEGPTVVKLVDWLLNLRHKTNGQIYIGGHNVPFDIAFLKSMLDRYKVTNIEALVGYKALDTFSLALFLSEAGRLKLQDGKLNLESIAKALNINLSGVALHTAEADTNVAAEIYYRLLSLVKV